jgi:hypothetical protein
MNGKWSNFGEARGVYGHIFKENVIIFYIWPWPMKLTFDLEFLFLFWDVSMTMLAIPASYAWNELHFTQDRGVYVHIFSENVLFLDIWPWPTKMTFDLENKKLL